MGDAVFHSIFGTTSAHAENTDPWYPVQETPGNYLRARGEYVFRAYFFAAFLELPPRTRRILAGLVSSAVAPGTTSAHAENTLFSIILMILVWNYLRARGEYGVFASLAIA